MKIKSILITNTAKSPLLIIEFAKPIIKYLYTHRYYKAYDLPNNFTQKDINYFCNLATD